MQRLALASAMAVLALTAGVLTFDTPTVAASVQTAANTLQQQHSFGTTVRGTTVCVGPLSPTTDPSGNLPGVQIFGFTNGQPNLTWQVFSVSSQSAPTLVFQITARSVDHTVAPSSGNFLFHACVVKNTAATQDYDLSLNSFPVE